MPDRLQVPVAGREVCLEVAGEADGARDVTGHRPFCGGMGAVEADNAEGRQELGQRMSEGPCHRCVRPVMAPEPRQRVIPEFGPREVGGKLVQHAIDVPTQLLTVHRHERCL